MSFVKTCSQCEYDTLTFEEEKKGNVSPFNYAVKGRYYWLSVYLS